MNLNQLQQIMPNAGANAAMFYPELVKYMPRFGIIGTLREAAFLATIAEESGELRYTRELWGPTPVQERYEGRLDLGNTQPGDGKRFRGHGLIQVTGRANHARARDRLRAALGQDVPDFEAQPDQLMLPEWATASACEFWWSHGCNDLADAEDFVGCTRKVNGGTTHLERREAFYERAKGIL